MKRDYDLGWHWALKNVGMCDHRVENNKPTCTALNEHDDIPIDKRDCRYWGRVSVGNISNLPCKNACDLHDYDWTNQKLRLLIWYIGR